MNKLGLLVLLVLVGCGKESPRVQIRMDHPCYSGPGQLGDLGVGIEVLTHCAEKP